MANTTCGAIDVYDKGAGAILVAWPPFPGTTPDSYNVYLNGVLNQNVADPQRQATITGLQEASYNGVTQTHSGTYTARVAAVKGGVETASSLQVTVTLAPNNITLTTPMRRPFPFPQTGNTNT